MVVCIQDWGVYRFMPNLVFLGVLVNSAVLQTRVSLECSLLKTGYAVVWIVVVPASDGSIGF